MMRITITGKNTSDNLILLYEVFNTGFAPRWLSLLNAELASGESNWTQTYNKVVVGDEIISQLEEFKDNINFINANYDIQLPVLTSIDDLMAHPEVLNDLHEEFEIYGDRKEYCINTDYWANENKPNTVWPGYEFNQELDSAFLKLNIQIHTFENIVRAKQDQVDAPCSCQVEFLPPTHESFKPEDYLLFTPEMEWGYIYLGYSTLGKHWHSLAYDNDIDVVKRDEVRPQKEFSAEFYMNFRAKSGLHNSRIYFYNWWVDNNLNKIKNPDMKLSDFAFGYVPLAKLVGYKINEDGTVIDLDRESIDTMRKWNKDVWSKFDTIAKIQIKKKYAEKLIPVWT